MKKMFFVFVASLVAFAFVGCGTKYTPIANVKFDKANVKLVEMSDKYSHLHQSESEMGKKYNVCIQDWLNGNNLINNSSEYALNVNVSHSRTFAWGSSGLAAPEFSTSITVLKNGVVDRNTTTKLVKYDPGFFGNFKVITGSNKGSSEFEDKAIKAFCARITSEISTLMGR